MTTRIEKLFIDRYLQKVINCYCKECVEKSLGKKIVIFSAPVQTKYKDEYEISCPCVGCLHDYPKNSKTIIKFEEQTNCWKPLKCYECLEYEILCLNFDMAELKKRCKIEHDIAMWRKEYAKKYRETVELYKEKEQLREEYKKLLKAKDEMFDEFQENNKKNIKEKDKEIAKLHKIIDDFMEEGDETQLRKAIKLLRSKK